MFAIIRVEKHKSRESLKFAAAHQLREVEVRNSNPLKRHRNFDSLKSSAGVVEKLERLISGVEIPRRGMDKKGKDQRTVLAMEYLMAVPPDAPFKKNKKKVKEWATASLDFIREKHGADNVLSYHLQLDEKSPHLAVFVAPLVGGTLNAKSFTGSPALLSQLQDAYAVAMSPFGLERGRKNSKAKHESIKEYYARVNAPVAPVPSRLNLLFMGDASRLEHLRTLEVQHNEAMAKAKKLSDANESQARSLTYKDERIEALKENEALARTATARLLKATYTPAQFEKAMGVTIKGKADIFDAVIKAGKASNFAQALGRVVFVMTEWEEGHLATWDDKARLTPAPVPKALKTPDSAPAVIPDVVSPGKRPALR